MTPAATKAAKPDIVLLANADGKVKEVAKGSDKEAKYNNAVASVPGNHCLCCRTQNYTNLSAFGP